MRLMLCRCIRISAQVGDVIIVIPAPSCLTVVAEWLSADRSQVVVWGTTTNNDVIYHTVKLQSPAVFNEISTQAEWGTLHYAMKSVSGNGVTRVLPLMVGDLGWQHHIQDS